MPPLFGALCPALEAGCCAGQAPVGARAVSPGVTRLGHGERRGSSRYVRSLTH